jgi:hypothetical protein
MTITTRIVKNGYQGRIVGIIAAGTVAEHFHIVLDILPETVLTVLRSDFRLA